MTFFSTSIAMICTSVGFLIGFVANGLVSGARIMELSEEVDRLQRQLAREAVSRGQENNER